MKCYFYNTCATEIACPSGRVKRVDRREPRRDPRVSARAAANLPGLAGALRQAVRGQTVACQLDATVGGVDAGRFGQPTFGPMPPARGELRASPTQ